MLFKIIAGKDIFDLNPGLKAFEEFNVIDNQQMTAVALFADYDSPLRTKPEKERRELAAKIAGYPMEGKRLNKNGRTFVAGETPRLEKAIEKYREIQFDEQKALLEAYDQQIQGIIKLMTMDKMEAAKDNPKLAMDLEEKAAKLSTQLPDIKEAKKKIQDLMNIDRENKPEIDTYTSSDLPIDGDNDLSTIDKFMQNKKD